MYKLKLFTENNIIDEAVFLKRIAATNIKVKHRVRSNFVKFTSRQRSLLIKHRVEGNSSKLFLFQALSNYQT